MPRLPRSSMKTHYFHAMVQGIEKQFIFDNPVSMNLYLDLILKKSKANNIDVLAYCIMNNHAHLLIHVKKVSDMSKLFQCVNTSYAQYFNLKNKRVGYVFRNRYKSEGIYSIQQLYNVINYIHKNPITANICDKAEEYQYSSYKEYFGKKQIINKKILYHFFGKKYFKTIFKIST